MFPRRNFCSSIHPIAKVLRIYDKRRIFSAARQTKRFYFIKILIYKTFNFLEKATPPVFFIRYPSLLEL